MAKGKTRIGRLWTYVRDNRPFSGRDPPAAVYFYSRDRAGEHPEHCLAREQRADACRVQSPLRGRAQAGARLKKAPIAIGSSASTHCSTLSARSTDLRRRAPPRTQRAKPAVARRVADLAAPPTRAPVGQERTREGDRLRAQALDRLTRFLDDGRLCMSNIAAERKQRCVAVGCAPPPSIRSSRLRSSTKSIRTLGSPTSRTAARSSNATNPRAPALELESSGPRRRSLTRNVSGDPTLPAAFTRCVSFCARRSGSSISRRKRANRDCVGVASGT